MISIQCRTAAAAQAPVARRLQLHRASAPTVQSIGCRRRRLRPQQLDRSGVLVDRELFSSTHRGFSSSTRSSGSGSSGSRGPLGPLGIGAISGSSTSGGSGSSSGGGSYPPLGESNKEPPTIFGDHRRMYPLPRKRSVAALPLDVKHAHKFVQGRRGQALYLQTYWPPLADARAVVFFVHDYADHSSWFLRDLAVVLVQRGYGVVAMDVEGHGRSDGLRGQVDLNAAVLDLCDHYGALAVGEYHAKPCFLLGEGMGGTLAYQTYQMQGGRMWDGLALLSPLLAFPQRLRPPPFLLSLIRRLNARLGPWPVVPYSRLYLDMLTDPVRRQEVLENPFFVKHGMRLATCLQLIEATDEMQQRFEEQTAPFIILQGEEDPLHAPQAARELYRRAKSLDKTLRLYAGARHCLLGPPAQGGGESVKQKVVEDVCAWVEERVKLAERIGRGGVVPGVGVGAREGWGGGHEGHQGEHGPFEDPEIEHRP